MRNAVIEQAFENIQGYLPEDARRTLSSEVPRIKAFVDEEMDKFGAELIDFVTTEVEKSVAELAADLEARKSATDAALATIRADIAENDETLAAAVTTLEKELTAYEEMFRKAGTRIRQSAAAALQSAGFPVGMIAQLNSKLRDLKA